MRPQTRKIAAIVRATVKNSGFWDDMASKARAIGGDAAAAVPGSPNFAAPIKEEVNPDAKFRGQKVKDIVPKPEIVKPPKVDAPKPLKAELPPIQVAKD